MGSQNNTPQGNQTGGANTPPAPLSDAEKARLEAEAKADEEKAKREAEEKAKADEEKAETDGPPKRHAVKVLAQSDTHAVVTDGVDTWKHALADGDVKKAIAPSLRKAASESGGDADAGGDAESTAGPKRHAIEVLAKTSKHAVVTDGVETWKHALADGDVKKAIAPSLRK